MAKDPLYQANPDVSCGQEPDGAVLYNPDTDDTTVLNLAGRALWDLLAEPRTVAELAACLVATYRDVTAEQAAADAEQFVRSLVPDFVQEVDDGRAERQPVS